MAWFRIFPFRRSRAGIRRERRAGIAVVLAVLAVVVVGCTDDTPAEPVPEVSGEAHYVKQGTQVAYDNVLIGLGSVSAEGEASMLVHVEDVPENEVVHVHEGDTFQAGRWNVTVVRVDTSPDGVLLSFSESEAGESPIQPSTEQESQTGADTADSGGDPMDDPEVQAVSLGRQVVAAPGLRIGLGTTVNDTARILLTPDEGEGQEKEVRAGDEVETAGHTVTIVEVGDGVLYFRVDQ